MVWAQHFVGRAARQLATTRASAIRDGARSGPMPQPALSMCAAQNSAFAELLPTSVMAKLWHRPSAPSVLAPPMAALLDTTKDGTGSGLAEVS